MHSNMNRRALMAGAAAVPVAALPALPALASEPDPIIAVINAYLPIQAESDEAWRAYNAAADAIAPTPEYNQDDPDGWHTECDRCRRLIRAAPHMRGIEMRTDETSDRAIEAAAVVYDTMPTTVAGLFLLLETLGSQFVGTTNSIVGDSWDEYLPRLAAAVESIERRVA